MFCPVTETERRDFFRQNCNSFIPGYTGHCPTLRFHYGRCYGAKTKEIMQEMREKGMFRKQTNYRQSDYENAILQPIPDNNPQMDVKQKFPKYISGYTGFVPTLNFRYGKTYSRAADDSLTEFSKKRKPVSKSAPKLTPIRRRDEVARALKTYEEKHKFNDRGISPEAPPISGYTGHIPRVKFNEELLAQRYDTVVRRGLALLHDEREKRRAMWNVQRKIIDASKKYEDVCV